MATEAREAVCLAGTALRTLQAVDLYKTISVGEPTWQSLAKIAVADCLDGVISEAIGADTPRRRMLDASVDRIIKVAGCVAAAKRYPHSRPTLGLIIAREGLVSAGNALHYARTGETIKASRAARWVGNLQTAAFAATLSESNTSLNNGLGILAAAYNALLVRDYVKAWTDEDYGFIDDSSIRHLP